MAISLIVSLLTIGFTSAQISYDFDTDPVKRAHKPDFYGILPDESQSRGIIFGLLIVMSASFVAIKR